MDRLQAMQTLVRVVELGSFSAAAREAGSTQSAISKQVAALEKQLGAQLLARSTRALKLTEAGARYVDEARRLVAEIAEAESELRAGEHRLQGWLRVAASASFGLVFSELRTGPVWTFEAGPGADAPPGSVASVRVAGSLRSNSGEAVREAVLAGIGLAYAPGWLLEPEVARGEVEVVMPAWQGPALPVHLVSPPQRRQSGKVRAFGEHVAAGLVLG